MKNVDAFGNAGTAGVAVRRVGTPTGRAGLCGILGGALWFVSGVLGIVFPQLSEPGTTVFQVGGVVATASLVLLLVGFLGVAWGGALGGKVGKALFGVTMGGYAIMVIGALQTVLGVGPLLDPASGVALLYLLGRLISAVFAFFTGIAVLAARRWRGWVAFTPLLVGLCPLVGELGAVILFGQPSLLLNAIWGVFGALLGYAILAHSGDKERGIIEVRS